LDASNVDDRVLCACVTKHIRQHRSTEVPTLDQQGVNDRPDGRDQAELPRTKQDRTQTDWASVPLHGSSRGSCMLEEKKPTWQLQGEASCTHFATTMQEHRRVYRCRINDRNPYSLAFPAIATPRAIMCFFLWIDSQRVLTLV
jgi:hypothetical protein